MVLADKGADIYSLVYKPIDVDFLWRSPWGVRDPRRFIPTTGDGVGVWMDVYEGGWQTVVPHAGYPSEVAGADLGLHAELGTLPWDSKIVEDSPSRVSAKFWARGPRTPFFVEKTLSLEAGSPVLILEESVTNEAEEPASAAWLEHVALGPPFLADGCRLYVPPCKIINHPVPTASSSKLKPGGESPWPNALGLDGGSIDFSRLPGKEDRSLDMAYLADMQQGWYAVTNEQLGVGFALSYPSEIFRFLWFWRSLGGGWGYPWYGRTYNVGLEPCTSFDNTGLANAIANGTALRFEAGETVKAKITATAYTEPGAVLGVGEDGNPLF